MPVMCVMSVRLTIVGAAAKRAVQVRAVGHLRFGCCPKLRHGEREPVELVGVKPGQCARHQLASDQLHLVNKVETLLRGLDQDDAPVIGDADALNEPSLLHPVNDTGCVGEGHIEDVCKPSHRHGVVVAQQRQNVKMGHADAKPNQPLGPGAARGAQDAAKVGQHRLGTQPVAVVRNGRVGGWRGQGGDSGDSGSH